MVKIHLSKLLGERRLAQIDLANLTGIRPATISNMYNEVCKFVSIENIDKICKTLGCRVEDLIEYTPDK